MPRDGQHLKAHQYQPALQSKQRMVTLGVKVPPSLMVKIKEDPEWSSKIKLLAIAFCWPLELLATLQLFLCSGH